MVISSHDSRAHFACTLPHDGLAGLASSPPTQCALAAFFRLLGAVQALQLAVTCLSFDFVGTAVEDSSEDIATLQIPSPWRPLLEDLSTLQLFFDYYAATAPPLSNAALECLVRCASVRRSLFSSEDVRVSFLSAIVNITLKVLQTQQGLQHADNYHEFCRLLGRVRNNYQLSEIMAVNNFKAWIEHVADFTISSLQGWQWSSGSVHYLLLLWTRLVASAAYQKGDQPSVLSELMPKIIAAYVQSRLDSVQLVVQARRLVSASSGSSCFHRVLQP
jgi:exportin-7